MKVDQLIKIHIPCADVTSSFPAPGMKMDGPDINLRQPELYSRAADSLSRCGCQRGPSHCCNRPQTVSRLHDRASRVLLDPSFPRVVRPVAARSLSPVCVRTGTTVVTAVVSGSPGLSRSLLEENKCSTTAMSKAMTTAWVCSDLGFVATLQTFESDFRLALMTLAPCHSSAFDIFLRIPAPMAA